MTQTQNAAIITGASRGIGAGLVSAHRKLGYARCPIGEIS
jgi:short-subunit dehydrogenase